MSIQGDFLRSVEVRPNPTTSSGDGKRAGHHHHHPHQNGSALWTKAKLEPGQIVGVIDKVGSVLASVDAASYAYYE